MSADALVQRLASTRLGARTKEMVLHKEKGTVQQYLRVCEMCARTPGPCLLLRTRKVPVPYMQQQVLHSTQETAV